MSSSGNPADSPGPSVDDPASAADVLVFILDADATSRQPRTEALAKAGFSVVAFGSGTDILQAMVERLPAVALICDVWPDVAGAEVCRMIKARSPGAAVPTLRIGAVTDGPDPSGADAWIRASASPEELVAYTLLLARLSRVERRCQELEQRPPARRALEVAANPAGIPRLSTSAGESGAAEAVGHLIADRAPELVQFDPAGHLPCQYQRLVDLAPEAIGVKYDQKLVYVNQAFLDLVGASDAGQVLGRCHIDFIHPDDHPLVREQVRSILAEDQPVRSLEERFLRLDGTEVAVEVAAAPCDTAHGRAILVFVRDITRRKQFEEALRLREAELRLIMDSAPALIAYVDAEGRYRSVNKSYQRQFGLASEDLPGRHVREVLGDAAWTVVEPHVQRALAGEHVEYEQQVPYSPGGVRWIAATYMPDRDEAGIVRGFVAQVLDISKRKAAEAELVESEQRFRQIAETINHVFWIWELNPERVLYVSPAFQRIWGSTPEELYANPRLWVEAIHSEDRAAVEGAFEAWIANPLNGDYEVEFRIVRSDGALRWISDRGTLVRTTGGQIHRITGIAEDITARKLTEEALREQIERYELVVAGAHDAIWDWDVRKKCVFYSPQWKALRGLDDDEVGDQEEEWSSRIHPEDAPRVVAAVRAYLNGDAPVFSEEYRTLCRDGSWKWIIDRGIAQRDTAGRVVRMAGSESDITERKYLEQALRASEQFKQGVLDSLHAQIAVLDARGVISAVNEPWRRFRRKNGCGRPDQYGVGTNYLEACRTASLSGDETARQALRGIESVLSGQKARFQLEYRCHSPDGERWFLMHALRPVSDTRGVIVTHLDISPQKRIEQALRDSQADLEQAQAIGQIGSWRLDARFNKLIWSDEHFRIFGVPPGTPLTYQTFLDTVHPDDRDYVHRQWTLALRGVPYDVEHRIIVDGHVKWVRELAELELERNGTVRGAFGTTQDITERKRAEDALSATERRLRAMIQAVPSLTFEADAEGNNTFASESWYRFTGMTLGAAAGCGWQTALHADDASRVSRIWGEVMRSGALYESKHRLRSADGAYRWFIARALPIRDADGIIERWAGSLTDINDLVQSEAALRASETRIRQMLEALPQPVWTCRTDGICDYLSPQWSRYTGIPERAQLGRLWLRQLHRDDRRRIMRQWHRATATGAIFEAEVRILRADGVYHWFQSRGVPLRDDEGRIIKWLGVGSDIEDLKRAEQGLLDAHRRKDEFLAMLSHELRNPLAPIRTATAVLCRLGREDPELLAARDIIARQVDHMTLLIDDLLDVSRIMRGQIPLNKQVLTIADIVEQTIEASGPIIDARRHRLTVALPENPVYLEGDPVRLIQVMTNLLRNAAKFTDENGEIRLTVETEDRSVVLRISDNGIGIPADLLPLVFDTFTQGPRALDRSQGGLGLGLSLAKQLVEMHGGTIAARSGGLGQGSEFTVRLPCLASIPRSASNSAPTRFPAAPVQARRILVVDDNKDAAQALALLLTLEGHDVREAHDGPSAIELARMFHPQLVLLDIGLPGMDGFEVAERLRQCPEAKGVVLVAITGYAEPDILRRSRQAGFRKHLVKPVETDDLLEVLASSATEQPGD